MVMVVLIRSSRALLRGKFARVFLQCEFVGV